MARLVSWLSRWPLGLLHAFGSLLGWGVFLASGVYRRRFIQNARQAGFRFSDVRGAVGQAGRLVAELPRLWSAQPVPIACTGIEHVEAAHATGRGLLFLTPHLGSFEVTAQAYAARYASVGRSITVMYRPARQAWLQAWMGGARDRPGLKAVPTTLAGIKQMLKALKAGEAVGLLPDQVPPEGQGVWSDFFGHAAYTMTLSARLALQTDAVVLLVWGERLPAGQGYVVHFEPFPQPQARQLEPLVNQINQAMERLVRRCPRQYLWGYARYKQPRPEA